MNVIQIGRKRLSEIVWNLIDEEVGDVPWREIEKILVSQNQLRYRADYKTGSLPEEDAGELYRIIKFFQPDAVAEVGTYIGVSTLTINLAKERLLDIYTCDLSNDIDLDIPNIFQYRKIPSHEMFKELADKGVKIDLVYLDGRLGQQDVEPLNKIIHERTVFVMDDFEGVEKGVANAMMLESTSRVLIYPREGRRTAMSIPLSILQIVPQEAT